MLTTFPLPTAIYLNNLENRIELTMKIMYNKWLVKLNGGTVQLYLKKLKVMINIIKMW